MNDTDPFDVIVIEIRQITQICYWDYLQLQVALTPKYLLSVTITKLKD